MAENSSPTAKPKRGPGRPFEPGQSGNPGGRPRGLASAVRETLKTATRDGEDPAFVLARFFAAVVADPTNKLEHRMEAGRWLSDRGWGKAPIFAPIADEDPLDLAERETTELAAAFDGRLDELAARRRQQASAKPDAATG